MHWKMAKSWPTFIYNFNENLLYSMNVFSVINFWNLNKILSRFNSLMTKIFWFTKISQLPMVEQHFVSIAPSWEHSKMHQHNASWMSFGRLTLGQWPMSNDKSGNTKGEVSLYPWPPVWLIWNYNWKFLFLFAKQTNPNQFSRMSMVQWYFPL